MDFFKKGTTNSEMIEGLRGTLHDDILAKFNENAHLVPKEKTREENQLELEAKNAEMLMKDDIFSCLKEFEFTRLVRDPKIVEQLVYKFFEKDPKRIRDT